LGLENAVIAVCGPISTTQSVIDLLAYREFESKQNIGKKQGYIGWRNNRLVVEEFSAEMIKSIADGSLLSPRAAKKINARSLR
jgi:hypothetical protein